MATLTPWPRLTALFSGAQTVLDAVWQRWLSGLVVAVNRTPQVIGQVNLTDQSGTISATAIDLPALSAGLVRLTYTLRKTTAGASSSSTTLTVTWTWGGVSCSYTFPAYTTNTVDAIDSQTLTIRVDAGTTISYAIAYATA